MHVRSVHHIGLVTGQFERMRRFYIELLGLPVSGGFPDHQIVFLHAGSTRVELLGSDVRPRGQARGGWHHLALAVDDVDAAFSELSAQGAQISSPPEDFPPEAPEFRIAFLRDPDGNLIELIQRSGGQVS